MNLVVRTYAGFEEILSEEIIKITGITPTIGKRAVYLEGDLEEIYKLNLHCRLALDVLVELHNYKAKNEDELYNGALKYDWSKQFTIQETFSLNSVVHSPFFNHSKYASLKIKDAIVDQFKNKEGKRPSVDREDPDHRFLVRITHDNVHLLWNSSGDPLYKRGYRSITGMAPLNEVLAAGILTFSGWTKERTLIDPMCGSGTFLCEALMMAKNIAPGSLREIFGFAKHKNYDHGLWLKLKEKANDVIESANPDLIGYDLLNKMVFATKNNLKAIYPNHSCPISEADFLTLECSSENALIIMNPPYNVRIPQEKIHDFYSNIGTRLKHEWTGSDAWILSGDLAALKHIGLRPKRRIKLFNGPIETKLVHIPLYRGSKKQKSN
jgi:putative N6-adenine-specific DNA methylase